MEGYPVLIFGHFLQKYESRRKYTDLELQNHKKLISNYVTPKIEYSNLRNDFGSEKDYLTSNERIFKLNQYFSKKHWLYIHSPLKLLEIFNLIKPNAVIVENEPHSFVTIEVFLIYKLWTIFTKKKKKFIIFSWDNLNRRDNPLRSFYKKIVDKFITQNINLVICGNSKCKENFKSRGLEDSNLVVHPQVGIDLEGIKKVEKNVKVSLPKKTINLFYCGRIVYEKGVHLVLRSHEKLIKEGYKIRTIIAGHGEGKYYQKIKKEASKIESLILLKTLKKDEMYEKFSESHIFILASIATKEWAEQFGLTVAEAMACKNCLAIGSNCGAIPEVISNEKLIFKQNSLTSLYELLLFLIKNDDIRDSYSIKQSKFARDNYSFQSVADLYGNSLSEVFFK
tara:strand:- start:29410 stop:30594 length:1185 start_codon:yes stop_codon:yes gene_type:complete